jgi:phage-related protein
MDDEKEIRWVGSAYNDLMAFPKDACKEAGFQLGKVQAGLEPADWKPFDYVAKFEEASYVLHCFQKKTQVTSKQDMAIASARYRALVNVRKEKK